MKKSYSFILMLQAVIIMAIIITSCKKKEVRQFHPDKFFTPTSISINTHDTSVEVSWPASLYSTDMDVSYTVEFSNDSLFQSAPALAITTDTTAVKVTDDSLEDRIKYFVRVRANASGNVDSSSWMYGKSGFTLSGVQIFNNLLPTDVLDDAIRLTWTPSPNVNLIIITDLNTKDTLQIPVTNEDNMAGMKIIDGLQPATAYTASIYAGTKSKGLLNFTTQAPLSGNIVDLRNIKNRTGVLNDTLPQIASGSIILLKRGQTYLFPDGYTFDKSVTIMSGKGFSEPATVMLASNFDAEGNIDSVVFSDLTIGTNGSGYFMNVSNTTSIGLLKLSNCISLGEFSNSFIRLKTKNDLISNLWIDNCILDSIGVKSKYAMFYANASSSALINNIEISNSTFYNFYYFIRQDKVSTSSLKINNCTFNAFINQGGYFIKYTDFPSVFSIHNCIFGSTLDPADSKWISSASPDMLNCYATSDCIFSSDDIFGVTRYSGTSEYLFKAPGQGDFTIMDNNFSGRKTSGDPRWRP